MSVKLLQCTRLGAKCSVTVKVSRFPSPGEICVLVVLTPELASPGISSVTDLAWLRRGLPESVSGPRSLLPSEGGGVGSKEGKVNCFAYLPSWSFPKFSYFV